MASSYEQLRQENMRRNQDFMNSLGLDSIKAEISDAIVKPKATTQKGKSKSTRKKEHVEPLRRSSRATDAKELEMIAQLRAEGKESEADAKQKEFDENKKKKMAGDYEANMTASYESSQRYDRIEGPISIYPCHNAPSSEWDALEEQGGDKEESDIKIEGRGGRKRSNVGSFSKEKNTQSHQGKWGYSLFSELKDLTSDVSSPAKKTAKSVTTSSPSSVVYASGGVDDKDYQNKLKSLSLKEEDCAKVVEARITQTIFHPTSEKLLCLAGDKMGCLGIWDVNHGKRKSTLATDDTSINADGVYKYMPHIANITSIHCWANSANKIYSTSYDGTVRCLDIHAEEFDLFHTVKGDIFDNEAMIQDATYLRDGNSILLGMGSGDVALLDARTGKQGWFQEFHQSKINSIQQNPMNENILITASGGVNGKFSIHDLRMVGKSKFEAVHSHKGHTKSINAAYFSGDGDHVVTVGQDNYVFCWSKWDTKSPSIKKQYHDNHTGRWLSTLKPSFDPKAPNTFVLGCMDKTRKMEIFNINRKSHCLDKCIDLLGVNSVQSRNCFHPSLDVVAGGNSSGRVSVFQ